jgi:hypothetical protein
MDLFALRYPRAETVVERIVTAERAKHHEAGDLKAADVPPVEGWRWGVVHRRPGA